MENLALPFEPVNSPNPLDTLAQLGTSPSTPEQDADFKVVSQTVTDRSVLLKRARAKYLTNAIVYRLADIESPLNKAYWNSYHCSSKLTKQGDKITGQYCKNRWCMVCNRIRTAKLIRDYMPVLDEWHDKHFLTLTVPNVPACTLQITINKMVRSLKQIQETCKKRSQRKRDRWPKILGLRKLECTYNPERNDYHPHFHIIVDSKYAAHEIKDQWLKKFPLAKEIAQDIRPADANSCIELFKYFTKVMTKTTSDDGVKYSINPFVLDEIFRAIKGVRTFQTFGFTLDRETEETEEACADLDEVLDEIVYGWMQEFSDWVDIDTGETLSGYVPSEKMIRLTEGG